MYTWLPQIQMLDSMACFQEKCLETANIAVLFVNPHSDISAKCDSFMYDFL